MKFWAKEEVIWTLCLFLLLVNLVSCYILHLSLTWWLSLLFLRSNWKLRMIMVGTNEREGPRLPESLIGLALPRLMIPISESFVYLHLYLHLYFICIFGLYTPSISLLCFVCLFDLWCDNASVALGAGKRALHGSRLFTTNDVKAHSNCLAGQNLGFRAWRYKSSIPSKVSEWVSE